MKKKKLAFPSMFFSLFAICSFIYFVLPMEWQQSLYATSNDFKGSGSVLLGLLRLVTYNFCHASIDHLCGNFFFFFPAALYLENRLGKKRFLAFYLLCGICSGGGFLAAMAIDPLIQLFSLGGPTQLLGASGAIFGCFIYSLILWGKESWGKAILSLAAALYFVLPNCYGAVMSLVMPTGVAYMGHICGAIGALLFAHYFKPLSRR